MQFDDKFHFHPRFKPSNEIFQAADASHSIQGAPKAISSYRTSMKKIGQKIDLQSQKTSNQKKRANLKDFLVLPSVNVFNNVCKNSKSKNLMQKNQLIYQLINQFFLIKSSNQFLYAKLISQLFLAKPVNRLFLVQFVNFFFFLVKLID